MTKVFVDTNVVIDLLDQREPFVEAAAVLFALAYQKKIKLYVSPLTYATASFILRKRGSYQINSLLSELRSLSEVTIVDEQVVDNALTSTFADHEDALQHYSALTKKVHVIITRNTKDFRSSTIPVLTPDEFLNQL
ncbi:MAG: PIN domain-containing protein [Prevotellaceae bacterium]|jgi:predicted nucleic acid-binding protein|nr:PIN domain-containing protein [Prevotellaceae bacterium]